MKQQTLKKALSAFLAVVMVILCIPMTTVEVNAETEGYYTYEINDGETTITDVDESISGDIVIPDTLGGYPVTSIGYWAFLDCTGLKSVTIPDSVTSIGEQAFEGCTSLKEVHITDIAAWCDIDFSDSTSNPLVYAENLYLDGELVTNLVIPNGVKSIGKYAFASCTNLTSVTIGDDVTSIGDYAFRNCTSLENVVIPDSVTIIGNDAFAWCENLTSATIPDGVTSIGEGAFSWCKNLTSVTIPDGVTGIGNSVFLNAGYYNDSSNWDNNVLYIGKHLIEANNSISGDYTIKDGTLTIADLAFWSRLNLTSVTVPESVTNIGDRGFSFCSSLTSINVSENNIAYKSINGVLFTKDGKTLIQFPAGKTVTAYDIPDSVTSIGDYAFFDCKSLMSVIIPDSVTSIGDLAFYWCRNLVNVAIRDSVTSIGVQAFSGCDSLTDVYYSGTEDKWKTIDIDSGNDCLTNATIHYNAASIPDFTYGDVNMDGKVNLGDVSLLLKYIAKWDVPLDTTAADVTDDRKVNLADVSLMLKYIAKWDVVLGK